MIFYDWRLHDLMGGERTGEVGSTSFYLRKSRTSASDVEVGGAPPAVLVSYVAKRMREIRRRTKKIWTLLGCLSCE